MKEILASGDEKAFRDLYNLHTPRLLGFVYRLLGRSDDEAEDVVQETWIRVCKNLHRFRWDSVFSTWLHGIGINIVRDHIRRKTRLRSIRKVFQENPPDYSDSNHICIDLESAIKQLPDGYRMVLVLHDVEGMIHREIAQHLGISVGTSKSQLFSARKILRTSLSKVKEIS